MAEKHLNDMVFRPPGLVPDRPAYSPDGVDLTLIRWFLTLTPSERLAWLQGTLAAIQRVRNENES